MKIGQKIALSAIRGGFRIADNLAPGIAAKWAINLFTSPQERVLVPLSPFFQQASEEELEVDGQQIRGFRWPRENAPKAMVLHGFESSVTNFEAYAQGLYLAGFEVLAFDGPSSGRSEGRNLTPINYASMVGAIIQVYGPIAAYVAHSFAAMALGLALEQISEQRIRPRIAIIAGMTETTTAAKQFFEKLTIGESVQSSFHKEIRKMTGNELSWYSLNRIIPKLKADICWFHDKEDEDTPLDDLDPLRFSVQQHVRFIITEGFGHRQIYKEESVQKEVIQFLAQAALQNLESQ